MAKTNKRIALILTQKEYTQLRLQFMGSPKNNNQLRVKNILNNRSLINYDKILDVVNDITQYRCTYNRMFADLSQMDDEEFITRLIDISISVYPQGRIMSYDDVLFGKSTLKVVNICKILGYHLMKTFGWSCLRTAKALNRKNHSTILWYCKEYLNLLKVDRSWSVMHEKITKEFKNLC